VNDLSADLTAELAPPVATVAPAAPRRPVPAVSVVFTPLHWARPGFEAKRQSVVVRGGPWQVDVLL
jgi:hypothetical protein